MIKFDVITFVAGGDWLDNVFLFYAYLVVSSILSGCHAKHTVEPPEWVQDIFVMRRNRLGKFSICGVIGGCVTYVSWILFILSYFLIDILYTKTAYTEATKLIVYVEAFFIFLPMIIYSVVCWRIVVYEERKAETLDQRK